MKFVIVSIVVTEVLSMWENVRAITGYDPVAKKAFRKFLDQFSDDDEAFRKFRDQLSGQDKGR